MSDFERIVNEGTLLNKIPKASAEVVLAFINGLEVGIEMGNKKKEAEVS